MDRRWQLVLDSLEAKEPPFSKYTLLNFRKALIERDLDRRLIERTVVNRKEEGRFFEQAAAGELDCPLCGGGGARSAGLGKGSAEMRHGRKSRSSRFAMATSLMCLGISTVGWYGR